MTRRFFSFTISLLILSACTSSRVDVPASSADEGNGTFVPIVSALPQAYEAYFGSVSKSEYSVEAQNRFVHTMFLYSGLGPVQSAMRYIYAYFPEADSSPSEQKWRLAIKGLEVAWFNETADQARLLGWSLCEEPAWKEGDFVNAMGNACDPQNYMTEVYVKLRNGVVTDMSWNGSNWWPVYSLGTAP